jgi:hypothetical protein
MNPRILLVAVLLLQLPLPTGAADAPSAPRVGAALKAGGAWHGLFSELEAGALAELEVGGLLLDGRLELDVTLAYARPLADASGEDGRLGAGEFSWSLTQEVLAVGLLARWRFLPAASRWNVYAAAGPRAHLLRTRVDGEADGETFGENEQTSTEVGLSARLGAELRLGPGLALAELDYDTGPIDGLITGDSSTTGVGLLLGYRMLF